ncbi:hypothetical protein GS506_07555 [Rhodococcus hoagii]|nr:hypothetical protein [Prescottella equi]
MLARLDGTAADTDTETRLSRQAQILERAHDVLVESLAAVDKSEVARRARSMRSWCDAVSRAPASKRWS